MRQCRTRHPNFTLLSSLPLRIKMAKTLSQESWAHLPRPRNRCERSPELASEACPFVLRRLPLRRRSSDNLLHRKRNGKFLLEPLGHPRLGLSCDHERLTPIGMAGLGVRRRGRLRFGAPFENREFFRLHKTGKDIAMLWTASSKCSASLCFLMKLW